MRIEFGPNTKIIPTEEDRPPVRNIRRGNARVGLDLQGHTIKGPVTVDMGNFFNDPDDEIIIEGLDDDNHDEHDPRSITTEKDPYNPNSYRAPRDTLIEIGDTAATALGGSEYLSPTEKLAAVLAHIEANDRAYYDDDDEPQEEMQTPARRTTIVNHARNNDRLVMQGHVINGNVYYNGKQVDPHSLPEVQIGGSVKEDERPYSQEYYDTLEELAAVLKRIEDHGDDSEVVR